MHEQRHSYGVIPLFKGESRYEVLLIQQSRLGPKVWGFPKGTPEKGETGEETALREAREEIGVDDITLDQARTETESYSFTETGGSRIDKKVTYYRAYLRSKDVHPQESEVDDHAWVPLAEVATKLTYPESRDAFEKLTTDLI